MRFERDMLLLYAVTDRAWTGKQSLDEQVEEALQGGVTLVQLREKRLSKEQLIEEARRITAICHRYGVPLIVNDDYEAALAAGADGVHVGIEDTPVAAIRARAGKNFIIGATAKTVEQAQRAEREGADYLGVGAVFPSPTKQSAIRITNEQLREICAETLSAWNISTVILLSRHRPDQNFSRRSIVSSNTVHPPADVSIGTE